MKILLSIFFLFPFLFQTNGPDPKRFEDNIVAYEKTDMENPPSSENLTLFVGSSSIVMWKTLKKDFKKHNVINRGFGGSHNSDVIYYFDRIVKPYNPSKIVYYEGDNDITTDQSVDQIFANFLTVTDMIKKDLPDTKVAILAAKPSPSRWHLRERYSEYNGKVQDFCKAEVQFEYADIHTPMIGKDGRPKSKLYGPDSLHMSPKGYKLWKKVVKDFVTD